MSSFAAIKKASSRRAEYTCIITPEDYADTYEGQRPTGNQAVGVAVLSEADVQASIDLARRTADERCSVRDDNWVECYNAKLIAVALAHALVDPNDVAKKFFPSLDMELTLKLRSSAISRLWSEFETAQMMSSPVTSEASPDDLAHLVVLIERGTAWERMSSSELKQCRRYLEAARELLEQADARGVAANG